MTQLNSVGKHLFVRVYFVKTVGFPMQDLHSFSFVYADLDDQLSKFVVISRKIVK